MHGRLISASQIRDLHLCERKFALDLHGDPAERDPVSPFLSMLWRDGLSYEADILSQLGHEGADLRGLDRAEREIGTRRAIEGRAPLILGSIVEHGDTIGMPDIIRLTERGYVASDVKAGAALERPRDAYKQPYLVQVAHYARILHANGDGPADVAGIVGRDGVETPYDLNAPLGRDRISGIDLHASLLGAARAIIADGGTARGALSASCAMCEWKSNCRRELIDDDDLTLIAGLGRALRGPIETIATTVSDLAELDPDALRAIPGVGIERLRRFADRARMLADPDAGPILRGPLALPLHPHEIDFDVEADPMRGIVYLHGFWHQTAVGDKFIHFFAETPDEAGERAAFADAIDHFRAHRDAHWFHYSQYERTAYRDLARRHPDVCGEDEIDEIFAPCRCTDLYAAISKHTDWPLSSYGVKPIAKSIGFSWEDVDPSGAASIEWYDRYVVTGDPAMRGRIVAYNRDDVKATLAVRRALRELEATGGIAAFRRLAQ